MPTQPFILTGLQWGLKAELALLADRQRTVYPYELLPISCRSGADQWKFADQRPTFYHWATQPGMMSLQRKNCVIHIWALQEWVSIQISYVYVWLCSGTCKQSRPVPCQCNAPTQLSAWADETRCTQQSVNSRSSHQEWTNHAVQY